MRRVWRCILSRRLLTDGWVAGCCYVQVTKFAGVHSLDLYIPHSLGAPETKIHFIGIKGEFTQRRREAVIAVYESRAMPSDHPKVGADQLQGWGPAT